MKKQVFLLFAVLTILLLASVAKAAPQRSQAMNIGDFSASFVMQIACVNFDFFTGDISDAGSGTGFIYRIDSDPKTGEKTAIVFTNKHVIAGQPFHKRHLLLQFSGPEHTKEEAIPKLIYISKLRDFAVLKFKMNDLSKELQSVLRPGIFPIKNSPFYDFAKNVRSNQGTVAIALGNPLGEVNITSYGEITGLKDGDEEDGPMIVTQAPINPGNSGGPLVLEEDGTVIGINTQKKLNADNMGYAIPIAEVIEEFEAWEKDRTLGHQREVLISSGIISESILAIHGSKALIEKASPGYFKRHSGALLIQAADPSSLMEIGDQVFKVNGEEVGTSHFNFHKGVFYSKDTVEVELVRRNKDVLKIKVPIRNDQFRFLREEIDVVYLSGLLLAERSGIETFYAMNTVENHVWVNGHVNTSQTNLQASIGAFPTTGSILQAVRVRGVETKVDTIGDLKKILKALPEGVDHIELLVREPLVQILPDGRMAPVENSASGIQHNPHSSIFTIPVTKVLMYPQLDFKGFEEQFSPKQKDFKTRDFDAYTAKREAECEAKLKKAETPMQKEVKSSGSKRGPAWRKP